DPDARPFISAHVDGKPNSEPPAQGAPETVYLQIWQADLFKEKRHAHDDPSAPAPTQNELLVEIPGVLKGQGKGRFEFIALPPAGSGLGDSASRALGWCTLALTGADGEPLQIAGHDLRVPAKGRAHVELELGVSIEKQPNQTTLQTQKWGRDSLLHAT